MAVSVAEMETRLALLVNASRLPAGATRQALGMGFNRLNRGRTYATLPDDWEADAVLIAASAVLFRALSASYAPDATPTRGGDVVETTSSAEEYRALATEADRRFRELLRAHPANGVGSWTEPAPAAATPPARETAVGFTDRVLGFG